MWRSMAYLLAECAREGCIFPSDRKDFRQQFENDDDD